MRAPGFDVVGLKLHTACVACLTGVAVPSENGRAPIAVRMARHGDVALGLTGLTLAAAPIAGLLSTTALRGTGSVAETFRVPRWAGERARAECTLAFFGRRAWRWMGRCPPQAGLPHPLHAFWGVVVAVFLAPLAIVGLPLLDRLGSLLFAN